MKLWQTFVFPVGRTLIADNHFTFDPVPSSNQNLNLCIVWIRDQKPAKLRTHQPHLHFVCQAKKHKTEHINQRRWTAHLRTISMLTLSLAHVSMLPLAFSTKHCCASQMSEILQAWIRQGVSETEALTTEACDHLYSWVRTKEQSKKPWKSEAVLKLLWFIWAL